MEQIVLNNTLPNQTISFDVDEKLITLNLRTTEKGLFCDLFIDGKAIFYGKRCVNLMPLLLNNNAMNGNLYFKDLYGNSDPNYEFFNERYILVYDEQYFIK